MFDFTPLKVSHFVIEGEEAVLYNDSDEVDRINLNSLIENYLERSDLYEW